MKTNQCDIGLIGLAVMGENLVLNMESKGFQIAVFNRTTAVTEKFAAGRGKGKNIQPTTTMEEFVGALTELKTRAFRERLGENGRRYIKHHHQWDAVIGRFERLVGRTRRTN